MKKLLMMMQQKKKVVVKFNKKKKTEIDILDDNERFLLGIICNYLSQTSPIDYLN